MVIIGGWRIDDRPVSLPPPPHLPPTRSSLSLSFVVEHISTGKADFHLFKTAPPPLCLTPNLVACCCRPQPPPCRSIIHHPIVGYQPPPALTSPPGDCVFLPSPPSLVAHHTIHCPLLPPPIALVKQPLRSSRICVRCLLSFSSSPVHCLH